MNSVVSSLTLKSSWVKILAPLLVVLLLLLLVCYHFDFIRYLECVAVYAFSIFVIVSFIQYTVLQCSPEWLLIRKPFALYSRTHAIPIDSLATVELKNYKGPYLKFTPKTGPSFTVSFSPLRDGEQDALLRYFRLCSVPVGGGQQLTGNTVPNHTLLQLNAASTLLPFH